MSSTAFPPHLLSDRVVAPRTWAAADAPDLYAAIRESYLVLTRWLPWADHWIADGARRLTAGTEFRYGIFDAKTDFCLGGAGLNRINAEDKIANLGYWVRTSASIDPGRVPYRRAVVQYLTRILVLDFDPGHRPWLL